MCLVTKRIKFISRGITVVVVPAEREYNPVSMVVCSV